MNACILKDRSGNSWFFTVNQSQELIYQIQYDDAQWTKEKKIDIDVKEFTVLMDGAEYIHIVYVTSQGDVKYCLWEDGCWMGRMLLHLDDDNISALEIHGHIIRKKFHILFLLTDKEDGENGTLMHLIWDGEGVENIEIAQITLVPELDCHIHTEILEGSRLYLFYLTQERSEVGVYQSEYRRSKWDKPRRLYGIRGEHIAFESLSSEESIHLLNLSEELKGFSLEHVVMNPEGNLEGYKICEDAADIKNPCMYIIDEMLHAMWIESNKVACTKFNETWQTVTYQDTRGLADIYLLFYQRYPVRRQRVLAKRVLAVIKPQFSLLLPGVKEKGEVEIDDTGNSEVNSSEIEKRIQAFEKEINSLRDVNRNQEKKIASLLQQLEKKQQFLEETEETFTKLIAQNRKVEEKYSIFYEVQQEMQKEIGELENQLAEEQAKNKVLGEENDSLSKAKEELSAENQKLERFISKLEEEKMAVQNELESYKNKSFVFRMLKK